MQNILDYIDWRGDISFETDGFNEVLLRQYIWKIVRKERKRTG